jgi:hypothetical protein
MLICVGGIVVGIAGKFLIRFYFNAKRNHLQRMLEMGDKPTGRKGEL